MGPRRARILFLEDLGAQAVAEMLNMNSKVRTINLDAQQVTRLVMRVLWHWQRQ